MAAARAVTRLRFLENTRISRFPKLCACLPTKRKFPSRPDTDRRREPFLFCLAQAQEEFTSQLRSGAYRSPVNYLTERGIQPKTQEEFGLGYAGSVKDLIVALKKAGIKEIEIPLGAGILKEKDQGVTCPFMGRIIFPLTDQRNATVGFGGRAVDSSAQAKYLNSPDSPIFNKRKVLFGLNQASIPNDTLLVVEGYFDVLTLHQAGFKNTVGLLGTEITSEQTAILKTLARNAHLDLRRRCRWPGCPSKSFENAESEPEREGGRFSGKAIRMRSSEKDGLPSSKH